MGESAFRLRRRAEASAAAKPTISAELLSRLLPSLRASSRQAQPVLGRLGELEVRLAVSAAEVRRAQALRYRIFYEEMSAMPDPRALSRRRDADDFDSICDHLLVLDHSALDGPLRRARPEIVGTYRLLRQEVAHAHGGFYSEGEFDIAPLFRRKPQLRFLEVGRSCVLAPYRSTRTLELLWHGIWAYVLMHRIDVMLGCASLAGTDPDGLAAPLSFLSRVSRAPDEWQVSAHDHLRVEMERLPNAALDARATLRSLPPLIKGYLRLGAYIGDGAVIDRQFGTTDVLIVLPVAGINRRYIEHFGADARRYAA
jgi:L-ornithine Nalpha-acyltransferase